MTIQLAAFLGLGGLSVVRLPALWGAGPRRTSWLALCAGAAALFMVGVVVPLQAIDGWLGGTNFVNLAQNVLATAAIWFMVMTATTIDGQDRPRGSGWELAGVIVAFSVPFLCMSRGATSTDFVADRAGDPMLWLYACIYMGYVVFLTCRLVLALRGRSAGAYWPIRLGALLMSAASMVEILYLTIRVMGTGRIRPVESFGALFIPAFYGGIVLIAFGLTLFPLTRVGRSLSLVAVAALLRRVAKGRQATMAFGADRMLTHTYVLATELANFGNQQDLSRGERRTLILATWVLDRLVPAPRVIKMVVQPPSL